MRQVKSLLLLSTLLIITFACNKDEDNYNNQDISPIYYQEFNVDTTNYTNDTVFYDVDNDGTFDIQVSRFIEIKNSQAEYEGEFKWINNPINFCYIKMIPSFSLIGLGDEINDNSNLFEWGTKVNYSGSTPVLDENHYWADGVFNKYFGFQLISTQDTLYGWFSFKHFELREIAINTNPNEPIEVGQKE